MRHWRRPVAVVFAVGAVAAACAPETPIVGPFVPDNGVQGALVGGSYSDCFWNYGAVGASPQYNIAYPDAGAIYWASYYRRPAGSTLSLSGKYPQARYSSIITYDRVGQPIDGVADYQIDPDAGSSNPSRPNAARHVGWNERSYTLQVTTARNSTFTIRDPRNDQPVRNSINTLATGPALGGTGIPNAVEVGSNGISYQTELLMYRIYIPDRGYDLTGGAGLPVPTLTLANGDVLTGQALCDATDSQSADLKVTSGDPAKTRLPDPSALLIDETNYAALRHPEALTPGQQVKVFPPPGQPGAPLYAVGRTVPDPATFPAVYHPGTGARTSEWRAQYDRRYLLQLWTGDDAPGASTTPARSGGGFFPNVHNNYVRTALHRNFGKVAVLKGKLPTTPATYKGDAQMTAAQTRYVSFCMNESVRTTKVMDCAYDEEVRLAGDRMYTIVVSRAEDRPANAVPGCGVTWIEWSPTGDGATDTDFGWFQIRNMLPDVNFHQSIQDTVTPGDEAAVMGPYLPDLTYYADSAAFAAKGCAGAIN